MTYEQRLINSRLAVLTAGDARVIRAHQETIITAEDGQTRKGKEYGYACTDDYRPGFVAWGATPADAARAAGFCLSMPANIEA